MTDSRFGISTHLFHDRRLTRDHLVHLAAHDFERIELFATRSHFDYHRIESAIELKEWLGDTRLELHSVHAPIMEAMRNGEWVGSYSLACGDEGRRKAAVAEVEAALSLASVVPFRYLVVHLGLPADKVTAGARENQPDAARRSLQAIVEAAARVHVEVALELIPNPLSTAASLVRTIEEDLEGLEVGICLDYGHANLQGDVGDAIEMLSGHLWATHVHDNRGRRDEHLVPYAGTIDWDAAMMATQKIGYDGVLMFEVACGGGDPVDTLKRIARARERLEKTLVVF